MSRFGAKRHVTCYWLFLLLFLASCGQSGPKTIRVSGTVKCNGEPVQSGIMIFSPLDEKKGAAEDIVFSKGAYKSLPNHGLKAGDYKVAVVAYKKTLQDVAPKDQEGYHKDKSNFAVPEKYMSVKTTDLKISVSENDRKVTFDVNLTD